MIVIRELAEIFAIHEIDSEVLAASIRNPVHMTQAALAGAHIATVPFKVLQQMVHHPLTDKGIVQFKADWEGAHARGGRQGLTRGPEPPGRRPGQAIARKSRRNVGRKPSRGHARLDSRFVSRQSVTTVGWPASRAQTRTASPSARPAPSRAPRAGPRRSRGSPRLGGRTMPWCSDDSSIAQPTADPTTRAVDARRRTS